MVLVKHNFEDNYYQLLLFSAMEKRQYRLNEKMKFNIDNMKFDYMFTFTFADKSITHAKGYNKLPPFEIPISLKDKCNEFLGDDAKDYNIRKIKSRPFLRYSNYINKPTILEFKKFDYKFNKTNAKNLRLSGDMMRKILNRLQEKIKYLFISKLKISLKMTYNIIDNETIKITLKDNKNQWKISFFWKYEEGKKNSRPHFHLLIRAPQLKFLELYNLLKKYWNYGFIHATPILNPEQAINYLNKYIGKDTSFKFYPSNKRFYGSSRDLTQPLKNNIDSDICEYFETDSFTAREYLIDSKDFYLKNKLEWIYYDQLLRINKLIHFTKVDFNQREL